MVSIVVRDGDESNILGSLGVDAIKKGLRLLILVGTAQEKFHADVVLQELGETSQLPPNFEHGGPG